MEKVPQPRGVKLDGGKPEEEALETDYGFTGALNFRSKARKLTRRRQGTVSFSGPRWKTRSTTLNAKRKIKNHQ